VLQNPIEDVGALCASQVLSEPATGIIFDCDVLSHDVGPIFKLLYLVSLNFLLLFLLFALRAFLNDWLHVEEGQHLVFAVVLLNELLNLPVNAGNLGNVKYTWALVFVFVQESLH
jgi:hypothetical protein